MTCLSLPDGGEQLGGGRLRIRGGLSASVFWAAGGVVWVVSQDEEVLNIAFLRNV